MKNLDELPNNLSPLDLSLYLSTISTPEAQWEPNAKETLEKVEQLKKQNPTFQVYLEKLERETQASKKSIKNKLFQSIDLSRKLPNQ